MRNKRKLAELTGRLEFLRHQLNDAIIKNNFNLQSEEVYKYSIAIDKLNVRVQKLLN